MVENVAENHIESVLVPKRRSRLGYVLLYSLVAGFLILGSSNNIANAGTARIECQAKIDAIEKLTGDRVRKSGLFFDKRAEELTQKREAALKKAKNETVQNEIREKFALRFGRLMEMREAKKNHIYAIRGNLIKAANLEHDIKVTEANQVYGDAIVRAETIYGQQIAPIVQEADARMRAAVVRRDTLLAASNSASEQWAIRDAYSLEITNIGLWQAAQVEPYNIQRKNTVDAAYLVYFRIVG